MTESPGGRKRDDDLPPSRSEADAQRSARALPLVWMIVGLILVVGFVLLLVGGGSVFHGPSASPGPIKTSSIDTSNLSLASNEAAR